ncbi:MAG: twin-arginine translocase TatA/TatE family subunit [Omnitrophica WOR_2 bacterium]|jgi:Tat protein translocase TatB subunit
MSGCLLFLDISGGEFLVIMIVAFLVFGPKKLPEIARKLGRTVNEIKSVSGELTREFTNETRNITNELKSARDSARVVSEQIDLNKSTSEISSQSNQEKNIIQNKPSDKVDVSNGSDNNETSDDVSRATK